MTELHSHSTSSPVPDPLPVDHAFVCDACDRRWYYTRQHCPSCGACEWSTYELEAGELLAWTDVAVTPNDVRSPNRIALVRFDDGVQLLAQATDDPMEIGDRVTFAGSYRLRDGGRADAPRLRPVE
ncbi:hypothetical protein G6M89_16920 [Natronolimnobius sp. AArcel1]|uniref:Zn-ribbon domain-containing OB-fold protein n=1 Tax=Natronolimnobius sp. AArcel1 TaxID=1679093 RepID=UPI0013EAFBA8|nr:OB-fold domain-containing protein [Natronolimnobius sp. AArcel1]NGM70667.1 hypothetical protein [Natronolimnobius sp. AArcel1]